MAETTIEWTDRVWNCIRGCSLVSTGCRSCYAMKQAHRFSGPGGPYKGLTRLGPNGPTWTGKVRMVPEKLADPLSWGKPSRVFVNSMSDLFHRDVTNEFIAAVFGVMAATPWNTYQVLTKRAERLPEWFAWVKRETEGRFIQPALAEHAACNGGGDRLFKAANQLAGKGQWPLPNVWLGVSCENQATADERIPHLLRTPAAVRFLSCEPLLGPVDLSRVRWQLPDSIGVVQGGVLGDTDGRSFSPRGARGWGIHWVIVGGESGPKARPMHPKWARDLRDQCQAAGVPYFFKQWGGWVPVGDDTPRGVPLGFVQPDGHVSMAISGYEPGCPCDHSPREEPMVRLGKKAAGRVLDGREWNEFPQPQREVAPA